MTPERFICGLAVLLMLTACGSDDKSSASGGAASTGSSTGGSAPTSDGGTRAEGGAGSGAGGAQPTDGGAAETATCASVLDPRARCPSAVPTAGATCTQGAICDFPTCDNGCGAFAFCPDPSKAWELTSSPCGGSCVLPTASEAPWSEPSAIVLARTDGNCGALGSLGYDPSSGKLEEFTCTTSLDMVQGCVYQKTLDCSLGDLDLTIAMQVAFRDGVGWLGEAMVTTSGAMTCSGSYGLALRR